MVFGTSLGSRVWLVASLFSVVAFGVYRAAACAPAPGKFWVFVGTYTDGTSKGIYRSEFDASSGKLSEPSLAAEVDNPSFLAIHPTRKFLYCVNESSDGQTPGAVTAFALDPKSGELTKLNRESSMGAGPCHLVVDATGKNVLVANYGGGSVAVLPIGPDGRLAPASSFIQHQGKVADAKRQGRPHAHSINLDRDNRFAVVADLGLDRIFVYKFDPESGKLTPNDPPFTKIEDRSGPRHFAFHPDGENAYVINEISCSVTQFRYSAEKGTLKVVRTVSTMPIPAGRGYSTAEVVVHPSGHFLYGSNRGHNSIAVYAIEPGGGRLKVVENEPTGGKTPRNFAVDPTGAYLLAENQGSDSIVLFRIDPETGALEPTDQKVEVPKPVCIKFVPVAD
jgi:6-phosphogluconolactonase